MTKIISFSGKPRSGKDTCCTFLTGICCTSYQVINDFRMWDNAHLLTDQVINRNDIRPDLCTTYAFADGLKNIAVNIFGLNRDYVMHSDKNQGTGYFWENMPGIITNNLLYNKIIKFAKRKQSLNDQYETPLNIKYHPPGEMSVRDFLQYIGSDLFRAIYEDCWVRETLGRIEADHPVFAFISDARGLNELIALKKKGAITVKLTSGLENSSYNEHPIESDWLRFQDWDLVIDNQNRDLRQLYQNLISGLRPKNVLAPF